MSGGKSKTYGKAVPRPLYQKPTECFKRDVPNKLSKKV